MRIKLVSLDGLMNNVQLVNADTGERLEHVEKVTIVVDARDGLVRATVELKMLAFEVDVVAETDPAVRLEGGLMNVNLFNESDPPPDGATPSPAPSPESPTSGEAEPSTP